RLRLGQHDFAAALDIAERPLAVAQRQVLRLLDQSARRRERFGVAFLEKFRAQLAVEARALGAQLLDRGFRLFLEARIAPEYVIEAARDLAREFDVWDLVLADGHLACAIDQNV